MQQEFSFEVPPSLEEPTHQEEGIPEREERRRVVVLPGRQIENLGLRKGLFLKVVLEAVKAVQVELLVVNSEDQAWDLVLRSGDIVIVNCDAHPDDAGTGELDLLVRAVNDEKVVVVPFASSKRGLALLNLLDRRTSNYVPNHHRNTQAVVRQHALAAM